jgi:putative transcriptional regulator
MAKLLKISKTYYWQLENNKRRISYDRAVKIAAIFDLKPDEIFYAEVRK